MIPDWKNSLYSDGGPDFLEPEYPLAGSKVQISIRVLSQNPIRKILIQLSQKGERHLQILEAGTQSGIYQGFKTQIKLKDSSTAYHFILDTKEGVFYYTQAGLSRVPGEAQHDFRILTAFKTSDWVEGRTFYQIFPDRFFRGDPDLTPRSGEYSYRGHPCTKMNWDEKPLEFNQGRCLDFFGGDLRGIISKLDYLQDLGVSALYLNPIFQAPSHHKYDCQDYLSVDSHLGGNQGLQDLMQRAKERDLRIILDISVNHTGSSHRWFNQEGIYGKSQGAFHDPKAPERQYYFKRGRGFHHWAGVDSLVTLNYGSKALRDEIYGNPDAVLKHWLKPPFEIDGWRFDVGHSMAREGQGPPYLEIWREIRSQLKKVNPNAWLMAEFWDDPFEFLQGDCWDASMNYYGFLRPVRRFLGETDWVLKGQVTPQKGCTAKELKTSLDLVRTKLPFQIQNQQFNQLGSHDIHRFHNVSGFDFTKHRLAAILLMTYPGVPCIYYGDEQELDGHLKSNEGFRYPMQWFDGQETEPVFILYQKLAKLRQKTKALSCGGYKVLHCQGRVLAYARFLGQDCVVILVSMEKISQEIDLPLILAGDFKVKPEFRELFKNHPPLKFSTKSKKVKIPEKSGLIFSNT